MRYGVKINKNYISRLHISVEISKNFKSKIVMNNYESFYCNSSDICTCNLSKLHEYDKYLYYGKYL